VQPDRSAVGVEFLGDGDEAFELPGINRRRPAGVSDPEDGLRSLGHDPPVDGA
jgi:hypothetical protein